jgi:hypothetical protein
MFKVVASQPEHLPERQSQSTRSVLLDLCHFVKENPVQWYTRDFKKNLAKLLRPVFQRLHEYDETTKELCVFLKEKIGVFGSNGCLTTDAKSVNLEIQDVLKVHKLQDYSPKPDNAYTLTELHFPVLFLHAQSQTPMLDFELGVRSMLHELKSEPNKFVPQISRVIKDVTLLSANLTKMCSKEAEAECTQLLNLLNQRRVKQSESRSAPRSEPLADKMIRLDSAVNNAFKWVFRESENTHVITGTLTRFFGEDLLDGNATKALSKLSGGLTELAGKIKGGLSPSVDTYLALLELKTACEKCGLEKLNAQFQVVIDLFINLPAYKELFSQR